MATLFKEIAIMLPSMTGGGTERAALLLANHWAERGVKVRLILFRREGVLLEELHSDIQVDSLDCNQPLVVVWRLVHYLRRNKIHTLLCLLNPVNAIAVCAKMLGGLDVRIVATVHNHLGAKYKHTPSMLNGLRLKVIACALRQADHVIAVSDSIKDLICKTLGVDEREVSVIYNPVRLQPAELLEFSRPRHPYFNESNGPVLIAAGRLTRQKNFQLLLRAMVCLPENVRLVILGEGEDRLALEALCEELNLGTRVSLAGFQSKPLEWFKAADCYVMSSDWEGFPFVLLEALSVGLSVVSTDCPSGPAELLDYGKYGRLVPSGDFHALADAIQEELSCQRDPQVLIRRVDAFNIVTVCEQYEVCLLRLAE